MYTIVIKFLTNVIQEMIIFQVSKNMESQLHFKNHNKNSTRNRCVYCKKQYEHFEKKKDRLSKSIVFI